MLGDRCSIAGRGKRFIFSPQNPYRLWVSPSLISSGYYGLFSRGVKLTTYLQLIPKSTKVVLYIHSPIRVHGVVFKCSSESSRSHELYGVTNQKTVFFIVTSVRTSDAKCALISSYIMATYFASESGIHISTIPPRGARFSLKATSDLFVVLLLFHYKRVVILVTGLLPGACCGIVSDTHIRSEVPTGYLKMATKPSGALIPESPWVAHS
jgi:hypothetical protein